MVMQLKTLIWILGKPQSHKSKQIKKSASLRVSGADSSKFKRKDKGSQS